MRMIPIFLGVQIAALAAAALAGFWGYASTAAPPESDAAALDRHRLMGLSAAVLLLLGQCVVFVYFLGTGKAIKTAVEQRGLPIELSLATRRLKGKTFPFATFSALAVVAGSVLAGAAEPSTHALTMGGALALVLLASWFELRAIRENGKLMDRTGTALEKAEEKIVAEGGSLADPDAAPLAFVVGRGLVVVSASVWLIYAYQIFVMRGRPQPWPWYGGVSIAAAIVGLPMLLMGRRRAES
ncbi:MAG: hypothetical protein JNJ88_00760 [Planctomycetes bacterium]|nr:hypothetical protein [Planctomycetota bacterium]